MQQMLLKVLAKGDSLFQFDEKRIIVKKKNGEYWVYSIEFDPTNGLPEMSNKAKIVHGKGTIELFDSETKVTIRR